MVFVSPSTPVVRCKFVPSQLLVGWRPPCFLHLRCHITSLWVSVVLLRLVSRGCSLCLHPCQYPRQYYQIIHRPIPVDFSVCHLLDKHGKSHSVIHINSPSYTAPANSRCSLYTKSTPDSTKLIVHNWCNLSHLSNLFLRIYTNSIGLIKSQSCCQWYGSIECQ